MNVFKLDFQYKQHLHVCKFKVDISSLNHFLLKSSFKVPESGMILV